MKREVLERNPEWRDAVRGDDKQKKDQVGKLLEVRGRMGAGIALGILRKAVANAEFILFDCRRALKNNGAVDLNGRGEQLLSLDPLACAESAVKPAADALHSEKTP